jgi:hypothetical protein
MKLFRRRKSWPDWHRADIFGLGRYIETRSAELLELTQEINNNTNLRVAAKTIYDSMAKVGIAYTVEPSQESHRSQQIRTPYTVLVSPRQGTCIDLALVYAGLCKNYDLQAIVLVAELHEPDVTAPERTASSTYEEHAFVAVCMNSEIRSYRDSYSRNLHTATQKVWRKFHPQEDRPYQPFCTDASILQELLPRYNSDGKLTSKRASS